MAVLLDALCRDEELLIRPNVLRLLCRTDRLSGIRNPLILRLIGDKLLSGIGDRDTDLKEILNRKRDRLLVDVGRGQECLLPEDLPAVFQDADDSGVILLRSVDADIQAVFSLLQVQCRVDGRILHISDFFIRHEVLEKDLLLVGLEPGEVRLVVAVHARHELDVRAVGIRQLTVPCLSEVTAPPGPLLFSGRDVMVCNMQKTCLLPVVIPADKVVFGLRRHVGGGDRDISVAGDINPLAVIMLVINAGRDREVGYGALAVIVDAVDIGREHGLRAVIDRHCRVGPPEEGLWERRAVVELSADLKIGPVRIHRKRRDLLRPVHPIHVIHKHRFATVAVVAQRIVNRRERRRAVVLRPVELNAAGDPGTAQADKCWLDDLIVVHKVIVVGLVIRALDASAQLRENHHPDVLIFKVHCLPDMIRLFPADLLRGRIGINLPGAALIDPLFEKHRVFVRFSDLIGRDDDLFLPHSCFFHCLPLSVRSAPRG